MFALLCHEFRDVLDGHHFQLRIPFQHFTAQSQLNCAAFDHITGRIMVRIPLQPNLGLLHTSAPFLLGRISRGGKAGGHSGMQQLIEERIMVSDYNFTRA